MTEEPKALTEEEWKRLYQHTREDWERRDPEKDDHDPDEPTDDSAIHFQPDE
jgi:hypothetical protein